MELKNLFDMVKADKYTADGREELIKAQKAETEDTTYNIGDISRKTGLMKTANGWVKPPKGKQPGAEKTEKKATSTTTAITEWEESAKSDAKAYNENMVVLQNAEGKTTIARESSPDVEKAEAHGYKKMSLVRPDGSVKKHEGNAGSKPAPKSLAGTPMKKADLNSKDPYEITHSMKPDTASEAKEMDRISAFMQEETGANLRMAIQARESFYKNTKNPTPEQQEGLAALMKIQQKLGYGKPAEGPALNGQKKTVSHQEYQNGPMYGPAESKPDTAKEIAEHREAAQYYRRKASSFSRTDPSYNTYLQKAHEYEDKADELAGIPGHRGMSAEDYDKKLRAEGWKGDWEGDGSRAFGYFKKDGKTIRVSQNGTDGSIGDVVEVKTKDAAPRVLTGDTRIRVRKA